MTTEQSAEQIREAVREHYAEAARRAQALNLGSCGCGSSCGGVDDDARGYYRASELREIPTGAAVASLGCGNPTLLAQLKAGETVLDLGSGGGIDVLLSAKRVGSSGKAYGLDMTDEMLGLARRNAAEAGVSNVEFLKGEIEAIPLPDASVDVIISNCVINLSADKDAVLREAFRVLKPGGRFAVADIVVQGGPLPVELRQLMSLWAGCLSGALTEAEYRGKLARAGFADVELQVLKVHGLDDVPEEFRDLVPHDLSAPAGTSVISAFVRATKPGPQPSPDSPTSDSRSTPLPVVTRSSCCGSAAETGDGSSACCSGSRTVDDVRAYFDKVAGQWDELREGYFDESVRTEVLRRLVPHPDMRVADVGSGTGFLAKGLAPLVAEVHCVDASDGMLDQARENLKGLDNVRYHQADGQRLPLPDESVDAVVANMYLHHIPDPEQALGEMFRILRPGGRLVITDLDEHTEEWMRAEMADVWLGFEREQVRQWLGRAGFESVDVDCCGESCCADKPEGGRAIISIFVAQARKPLAPIARES